MKILLTGSSGTIGTRLFERLLPGHDVIGVDIKPNKWQPGFDVNTINIDLRNAAELAEAKLPEDINLIIHLAANARVYELVKEPGLAMDNMLINFNVADFARYKGIKKIVFASSRETYGNIKKSIISENKMRLENCESPYSVSKLMGEALLYAYRRVYGIDFAILRFSNVYGMYDDSDRVIPLWIRQCQRNENLIVYGKKKFLDFTYIDDTVEGVIKIVDRFEQIKSNVFNIAYGQEIGLLDVAQKIKELTGSLSKIVIGDNRPGEVWQFQADIARAKQLLGYEPKIAIDEGLRKTVDWYLAQAK